jgi:hypothetical protein
LLEKLRTGFDMQAYKYRLQARRSKTDFYLMLNYTIRSKKRKNGDGEGEKEKNT